VSHSPLVSVITPTYNGAKWLSDTIDSALDQDYDNLEIIVADDGSTDGTPALLEPYANRIKVLRLPHRGENSTRNAAIAESRGAYVAFLDHDDLWLPTKISEQVSAMESHPGAGLCHSGWERFGEGAVPRSQCIHEPVDLYHGRCFETIFRGNGVGALTAMIRRTALPPHVFHEDIQITADYALWLDVLFYHEAIYIPRVLAFHRVHSQQITHGRRKRWKIYEAVSRLRLLDRVRSDMTPGKYEELRRWTLETLRETTYDRQREGDDGWAALGFHLLRKNGSPAPWYHHLRSAVRYRLHSWLGQHASERRYLKRPA
jgi:glycosyltransferase involved in cell wall biosynthesis